MDERADPQLFELVAFTALEFHAQDSTAIRLLLYSALEGNELSQMIFRQHIIQKDRMLAAYIKRRIAEGAFRQIDPMTAVRAFGGMIFGQVLSNTIFAQEARELFNVSNRQAAKRFTDIFLAGLRAENCPASTQKK
jgi:AcrR family transcriptional regulator